MVAPLPHRSEQTESSPALRRARQMVAAALLGPQGTKLSQRTAQVSGWKAWSFAVWTVAATALAAALAFGWLP